jgi:hypothetical protein
LSSIELGEPLLLSKGLTSFGGKRRRMREELKGDRLMGKRKRSCGRKKKSWRERSTEVRCCCCLRSLGSRDLPEEDLD